MSSFHRSPDNQSFLDFPRATVEIQLAIYNNSVILCWREKVTGPEMHTNNSHLPDRFGYSRFLSISACTALPILNKQTKTVAPQLTEISSLPSRTTRELHTVAALSSGVEQLCNGFIHIDC